MQSSSDVVIAGGGIIGCAIAYYLGKAGMNVTVLDAGEIGAEASSAAAGLLAPLGSLSGPGALADLLLASFALFPALVPQLEEVSGINVEYERTGALRLVRDSSHIANLHKRMKEWQPLGLKLYWLNGDEARQREPLLSSDVSAAVYAPDESQISAPQLTKAFFRAAAKYGANFYSHTEITGIERNNNRATAVYTAQGETIACNHLVIATGAWTARWSEWLDIPIPVTPQRGQILTLAQPSPPLRYILFGEAIYLASKSGETIIVGATREEVGFEKKLTAGGISWLLNTAIRLVPSLESSSILQMWAGLRPKSLDQQPILGAVPNWENITLAIGHTSIGITLSAITGKTIAELIATGHTPEIIRPFAVERFIR